MYIIRKNNYNFSEEQLFVVGKRDNNKKRSFLFISKLLGKHLAVKPEVSKKYTEYYTNCEYVLIPGAGHGYNSVPIRRQIQGIILDFLNK